MPRSITVRRIHSGPPPWSSSRLTISMSCSVLLPFVASNLTVHLLNVAIVAASAPAARSTFVTPTWRFWIAQSNGCISFLVPPPIRRDPFSLTFPSPSFTDSGLLDCETNRKPNSRPPENSKHSRPEETANVGRCTDHRSMENPNLSNSLYV